MHSRLETWLNTLNIKTKLWLFMIMPMAALLILMAYSLNSNYENYVENLDAQKALTFILQLSDLVRSLQDERGLSAGFVASEGEQFPNDLAAQRKITDQIIAQHQATQIGNNVYRTLALSQHQAIESFIQQLPKVRAEIDALDKGDRFDFYSNFNQSLLGMIARFASVGHEATFVRYAQSYVFLSELLEAAGQERGKLNGVFATKQVDPKQFADINAYISRQTGYIRLFDAVAFPQQQEHLSTNLSQPVIADYKQLQAIIIGKFDKNVLLNELYKFIGYGSLIHDFKNYVIRGNSQYLAHFEKHFARMTAIIEQYRRLNGMTAKEIAQLEIVKQTFQQYFDMTRIVTQMKQGGASVVEIDKRVKVNDAPALAAITYLQMGLGETKAKQWWRIASTRMDLISEVVQATRQAMLDNSTKIVNQSFYALLFFLMLFSITMGISSMIGYMLMLRLSKALETIAKNMQQMLERQDFSKRLAITGKDEIAVMAHTFNTLAEGYCESKKALLAEKEQTEQLLKITQEKEQLIQSFFTEMPDGLLIADSAGRILRVNRQVEHIFGYTATELIGQTVEILIPENYWEQHKQYRMAYIKHPITRTMNIEDIKGVKKDGSHLFLAINLNALNTEQGLHIITSIRDISELKRAEKENNRLLEILDILPDFVGTSDIAGNLLYHNPAAKKMVGLPEDADLTHFHIRDMHPEWASEILLKYAFPIITKKGVWQGESALQHRDGHEIPVSQVLMAHFDEQGTAYAASTVMRDITTIKATEATLIAAKEAADEANQAKSAFLATMSHEIRTPLNAIIGTSHLLQLEQLTPEQKTKIDTIQVSSKNLLALINDILDLSKIEAGELVFDKRPFSLASLLDELRLMFTPLMTEKRLKFHLLPIPSDIPLIYEGDDGRIRQMLINLINNAMKFTPAGSVTVTMTYVSSEADTFRFRFNVKDTGIGIAPEVQAKLFKPFIQAETSTNRRYGGTGLGLSIVKQMAEQMRGTAGFESILGKGSTFWFELPLQQSNVKLQDNQFPEMLNNIRVLIVKDDTTDCQVLESKCRAFGWITKTVHDVEALANMVIAEYALGNLFDCLIIDWAMLNLDSLQVIQILKQQLSTEILPAIVTITAEDTPTPSNEASAEAILHKPINASELFNQVNQALIKHGLEVGYVLQRTNKLDADIQWLFGLKILVIDDMEANLIVAQQLLEHEGTAVITKGSGQGALDELRAHSDDYDAVLMDVQMPSMDGIETTKAIRNQLKLTELPIIALTAGAMASEQQAALDAGMNTFLTKPIDHQALIRAVRELVEKRQSAPIKAKRRNRAEFESDIEDTVIEADLTQQPLFNIDGAMRFLGKNSKLYIQTVKNVLVGLPSKTLELQNHLNKMELNEASIICHAYKGLFRQLGSAILGAYFEEMETQLETGIAAADLERFKTELPIKIELALEQLKVIVAQMEVQMEAGKVEPSH